jgi:hypothetical protein
MADLNKTIQISYRADVQNLIGGLQKVGQVSDKEAKKIVNDLDKAYTKATKAAEKAAREQEAALKKVSSQAKDTGKGIEASFSSISIAAVGAGYAVLSFAQHIADMSNQLVDASTKTGVGVETLNGLRLAAEGAGLQFEDLEVGLVKLPQMMLDAADGSKTAQNAFQSLGVQTTETVDGFQQLRSADDVLKDVFVSLQNIESAEEKAARAADIFGKTAGAKFLQSGAVDNLEAFVNLANEFGVNAGPQMQKTMADFQRISATATQVITGEFMRLLDVAAGGEAGSGGGLNDIILGATQAFIIFGEIAGNTLKALQQSFGFVLASLNYGVVSITGTTDEAERALIVVNELMNEMATHGDKVFSPFEVAAEKLENFNSLMKATMSAPTPTGGTRGGGGGGGGVGATTSTTKAVDELAETTKLLNQIDKDVLDTMTKIRDERVSQLTGEEKIIALRDIELQKIQEEKATIESTVQAQIDKLKAMEQTEEVIMAIEDLEFSKAERLEQLDQQRRTTIQEAFEEQQNLILDTALMEMEASTEATAKVVADNNKKKKSTEEIFKEYQKGFGMVEEGLNIAADLIEQNSIKNKKNAELVFNIRKAAALSEIAIQTAMNVVEVFPNPFLMAGAAALGIAQGALVASEQPKFHMGGMIGDSSPLAPDETMVRAKKGEAILSTSAVSKIGESGIQALESGRGIQPQIIVMNPFKHYDRFIQGRDALGMGTNIGTGRKGY